MPHVDIIGGGVAGLSLGIYLQKNGIDTHIYEQHSVAGGLCTSWKRHNYTFNGCLHWILGARQGISFYHFWKELFDIDKLQFYMPAERVVFDMPLPDCNDENKFHFYTNIDTFESYLHSIAHEDDVRIKQWCNNVRTIIPLLDYLPPIWPNNIWQKIKLSLKLIRLVKILPFMYSWGKMSNRDYAQKFHSPFLREAINRLYDAEMRMNIVVFAQAYAAKQVAQYPIGGSAFFTQQLVSRYKELGGNIHLSCQVKSVITDNNRAVGLELTNGLKTRADYVVSAADWHWTVFEALKGRFINNTILKLKNPSKNEVFYSYCRLFMGVALPMSNVPHFARIDVEPLTLPDGTYYEHLEVETYNHDHTLAPQKCVTMVVNLLTREGLWWINLRKNNIAEYKKTKQLLQQQILQRLEKRFGTAWLNSIEITDLVTPATWHRYTGNLWGSSQGWSPNNITKRIKIGNKLPKLKNFMLCGHWTEAGGGIPIALYSARKVANAIIKEFS